MQELDYQAIGQRIRAERQKNKMTQERLGELCGLSTAHIGHIERGTRVPSLQTLCQIASALDVSVDFLLRDSFSEPRQVLAAVGSQLRGKSDAQVRAFLNAVKALADKIDELSDPHSTERSRRCPRLRA